MINPMLLWMAWGVGPYAHDDDDDDDIGSRYDFDDDDYEDSTEKDVKGRKINWSKVGLGTLKVIAVSAMLALVYSMAHLAVITYKNNKQLKEQMRKNTNLINNKKQTCYYDNVKAQNFAALTNEKNVKRK